eukprot:scaffold269_cov404-Prasinococcus_capsulatus_cf.AAC.50
MDTQASKSAQRRVKASASCRLERLWSENRRVHQEQICTTRDEEPSVPTALRAARTWQSDGLVPHLHQRADVNHRHAASGSRRPHRVPASAPRDNTHTDGQAARGDAQVAANHSAIEGRAAFAAPLAARSAPRARAVAARSPPPPPRPAASIVAAPGRCAPRAAASQRAARSAQPPPPRGGQAGRCVDQNENRDGAAEAGREGVSLHQCGILCAIPANQSLREWYSVFVHPRPPACAQCVATSARCRRAVAAAPKQGQSGPRIGPALASGWPNSHHPPSSSSWPLRRARQRPPPAAPWRARRATGGGGFADHRREARGAGQG